MNIAKHTAVTIHYTLSNSQGEQIESSFGAEPMLYLHGAENIIPGLEAALEGKAVGDKLEVNVEADQAYGEYHEGLRQEVPLEAFGEIQDIVPGMRFIAETEMGQRPVQVTEVKDESVVVDGNHPLAGENLHFSVEVMEVRQASEDEIAHGHIHAAGQSCGHDHGDDHECCGGSNPNCDSKGGCGCSH
ncbi:peptidylprolyl isomerase [Shewanella sp. WXL01]|uniref:peptidylprolyl isomerase n=1 Tax=Shewanella sp. WXL01 TaxID=2709721 RepID=UPI001438394E|nr:peptidylprolyl isomerase [Shewanella sp. WXL01]NKF50976.1 peptidylprolyl isomerase [Shewanella sp. WXL01]